MAPAGRCRGVVELGAGLGPGNYLVQLTILNDDQRLRRETDHPADLRRSL
jgi:hypothetical protein